MDQNTLEILIKLRDLASKELKNFQGNMQDAEKSNGTFGESLRRVGEFAAAIGLARLASEVFAFGKSAIQAGFDTARFYENAQIGFTTLLGSAQKANTVINQIKKDALATPLDAQSLVEANKLLLSTGMNAEEARRVILNLGKAVVATGGGNAELSRMAVNLQQVKNVGEATALDIKQFAFAGINIYQLLADATGKNVSEVKNMKVSYELLSKALNMAGEGSGKFANAFTNAGGSMEMVLSNTKEAIGVFFADLFVQTGLYQLIKDVLLDFTKRMNDSKESVVKFAKVLIANKDIIISAIVGIGAAIVWAFRAELIAQIVALGSALMTLGAFILPLIPIAIAVGVAFWLLKDRFSQVFTYLQGKFGPIAEEANKMKDRLLQVFDQIGSKGLSALYILSQGTNPPYPLTWKDAPALLKGIFDGLISNIGPYVDRIGQLLQPMKNFLAFGSADAGGINASWVNVLEGIKNRAKTYYVDIKKYLAFGTLATDAVPTAGQAFQGFFNHVDNLKTKLKEVWNFIQTNFKPVFDVMNKAIADASVQFNTQLSPAIEQFQKALGPFLTAIAPTIKQLFAGLAIALGGIITVIGAVLTGLITGFTAMLPYIIGFVTGVIQVLTGVVNFLTAVFTGNWKLAGQAVLQVVEGIWNVITSVFGAVLSFIGGFVLGFIGFFQGIYNSVAGKIIPDFVGNITGWFTTLWNNIVNAVTGMKNGVINGFTTLWGAIVGEVSQWPGRMVDWGKNLIQSFIDGIKSMTNAIGQTIKNTLEGARKMLEGHSPPKEGPLKEIDKWGFNIGQAWVGGLRESLSGINGMLTTQLSLQGGLSSGIGSQSSFDNRNYSKGPVTINLGGISITNKQDADDLVAKLSSIARNDTSI